MASTGRAPILLKLLFTGLILVFIGGAVVIVVLVGVSGCAGRGPKQVRFGPNHGMGCD